MCLHVGKFEPFKTWKVVSLVFLSLGFSPIYKLFATLA